MAEKPPFWGQTDLTLLYGVLTSWGPFFFGTSFRKLNSLTKIFFFILSGFPQGLKPSLFFTLLPHRGFPLWGLLGPHFFPRFLGPPFNPPGFYLGALLQGGITFFPPFLLSLFAARTFAFLEPLLGVLGPPPLLGTFTRGVGAPGPPHIWGGRPPRAPLYPLRGFPPLFIEPPFKGLVLPQFVF